MRTNEPELVHVFHDKHCDQDLSPQQLNGCINVRPGKGTIHNCDHLVVQKFRFCFQTKFSHYGPQEYHYGKLRGESDDNFNRLLGIPK